MREWVYSSKAGIEDTSRHWFMMDWDNPDRLPLERVGVAGLKEYVLPSKSPGHYHVIRLEKMRGCDILKETRFRKGHLAHALAGLEEGIFYLKVYQRVPDLLMLERFVEW